VPQRTVFLDTSFVIALVNKDDPYHARAKALDDELLGEGAILLLHWGILFEIADGFARLARRSVGLRLLARLTGEEGYEIAPVTELLLQEALDLYRSRNDKEWGLTDCTSFVLMRQRGVAEALTSDIHFSQSGFRSLLIDS
jgi:predicted nucleic acid-binding protein